MSKTSRHTLVVYVYGSLSKSGFDYYAITIYVQLYQDDVDDNLPLKFGECGEHDRLMSTKAALQSSICGSLGKSSWLLLGLRLRDLKHDINQLWHFSRKLRSNNKIFLTG